MLYLVEHFYSVQGEGKYVGTPSLFFRFGGCNLKCEGFGCVEKSPSGEEIVGCDTVYAVDRRSFGKLWMEIEELQTLIWIINSYQLPPHVDIVLTGGEPLIYANEPIFVEFIEHLISSGHRVTFETNATITPNFEKYPFYRDATYALSVKLSNSGEPHEKRVNNDALNSIIANANESFFKFSVDEPSLARAMEDEIDTIISPYPYIAVYCMPLGGNKAHIEANCEAVIELCKRRGFIYSDRLHIRIWDQNHGV